MKVSNRKNLPEPFVAAMRRDEQFEENEVRVTSLLKGTCEAVLERRHDAEIERDASEMLWLLFGTAVHSVLEQAEESENQLKEIRLKEPIGRYILTGKFDLYDGDEEKIVDYKTCSVWKIINRDYSDWRRQTLIYAWLMRKKGFPVNKAEIVAMMKDHSKTKAKHDATYPQLPVERIVFKFSEKDFEEIEEWIHGAVSELEKAETMADENLPPCSEEQRYHNPDKWAVMAKGKKRAVKLVDSENAAKQMIHFGHGDYIEFRQGEDKKCSDYCAVSQFCPYWKQRKFLM